LSKWISKSIFRLYKNKNRVTSRGNSNLIGFMRLTGFAHRKRKYETQNIYKMSVKRKYYK